MSHSLLSKLFEENLIINDKQCTSIPYKEAIETQKIIACYFSAHWCPPCRRFTPLLCDVFENWKENNEKIQIVFISSDKNEKEFRTYFNNYHGDWLSLKFGTQQKASSHFRVQGIPSLIFLDIYGNVLHENGTELIRSKGPAAIQKLFS